MEHSRRWWLHIGGSKMFEPLFRAEMSFLNHFFCKIFVFDISNWISGVIFFDGVHRRWLRGHFCSRFYACSPYRGWTPKWGAACSSYREWTSKWGAACSPYRGWTLKWGAACSPLRGWDCRPAETAVFSRFFTFLDAIFFACDSFIWANRVYFAKKSSPDVFSRPQGGSKHFTTPFRRVSPPPQLTNPNHKESAE